MKKTILIIFAIAVFLGLGYVLLNNKSEEPKGISTKTELGNNVVKITSSGFAPSVITINVGDTVDFINEDTKLHWLASAEHPSHNVYPEKGGCIGSAFDACRGLKQGEVFSFTFNHIGEWGYHDHLNATSEFGFGKVIVLFKEEEIAK